jgi:Cellulase (glycosyl hydrolase family 5)
MKDISVRQAALGISLLVACGGIGCGENGQQGGNGGAESTAGNSGAAGAVTSGGVVHNGGTTAAAGTVESGGTTEQGGTVGETGGSGGVATSADTGGVKDTGGIASSGGMTTAGGSASSGGNTNAGGSKASGGVENSGGSKASGGSGGVAISGGAGSVATSGGSGGGASSGGTTSSGGSKASGGSGGVASSGGTTSSGGSKASGGSGGVASSGGAGGIAGSTGSAGGSLPWLTVNGNKLQDPKGNTVILRGVSIEGLTDQSETSLGMNGLLDKITNKNDVDAASTGAPGSPGWYTKIVRLPVDPPGTSATYLSNTLKPAVDYATKLGLYAIVDLHYISSPYTNQAAVSQFWTQTAPVFSSYSNVFYEVFNESSVTDTWATYKATMQGWVNTIRGLAPKNIIISGSPSWDQTMGDAATNPLTGGNIMYSVHMYEQHYNKGVGYNVNQVNTAAKGVPLIMTEWGFCGSVSPACTGQPGKGTNIISTYGTPMLNWLEGLGGSWTGWCASNSWLPDMFTGNNWTLRTGQDEMGAFVKDWMYTKKDQNSVN